jgi:hypothetical protein
LTYLFDTNIVSELRRPERANPGLLSWSRTIAREDVFVSVITLLELERGAVAAARDPGWALALRRWMTDHVYPTYRERALPVTNDIAIRAAPFAAVRTVELADELIAATALVYGLTLVTHNTRHFTHTGVPLFDPFS